MNLSKYVFCNVTSVQNFFFYKNEFFLFPDALKIWIWISSKEVVIFIKLCNSRCWTSTYTTNIVPKTNICGKNYLSSTDIRFFPNHSISKCGIESCSQSRKIGGWFCENYQRPLVITLLLLDSLQNLTSFLSKFEIFSYTLLFQFSFVKERRV